MNDFETKLSNLPLAGPPSNLDARVAAQKVHVDRKAHKPGRRIPAWVAGVAACCTGCIGFLAGAAYMESTKALTRHSVPPVKMEVIYMSDSNPFDCSSSPDQSDPEQFEVQLRIPKGV